MDESGLIDKLNVYKLAEGEGEDDRLELIDV